MAIHRLQGGRFWWAHADHLWVKPKRSYQTFFYYPVNPPFFSLLFLRLLLLYLFSSLDVNVRLISCTFFKLYRVYRVFFWVTNSHWPMEGPTLAISYSNERLLTRTFFLLPCPSSTTFHLFFFFAIALPCFVTWWDRKAYQLHFRQDLPGLPACSNGPGHRIHCDRYGCANTDRLWATLEVLEEEV